MSFEPKKPQECPPSQRRLLIAAGLFTEALARLGLAAAAKAQAATAEFVLYAGWLRLLQQARSVQQSCYAGYAREQLGPARTMVNTAADLLFIAETDSSARALLYANFSIERRRRVGRGFVKIGLLSQADFDRWDATESVKEKAALDEARKKGIQPAPKFNRNRKNPPQTWSGLSDADLIKKVGRTDWYHAYYVPFSDAVHGSVGTAIEEIEQLKVGQISVGPRYSPRPLAQVVFAMGDTLSKAMETINKHFRLGKARDIELEKRKLLAALRTYSATLSALPESTEV